MKDLFLKHYNNLLYYGYKFVKDHQAVEDIVVDVFLYYHKKEYTNEVYLYVLVKNRCLNYIKAKKVRHTVEIDVLINTPIENEIIESEYLKNLHKHIDKLPEKAKQVIEMFYFQQKNQEAIAKELNKTGSTVRSLKRYALNILHDLLTNKTLFI